MSVIDIDTTVRASLSPTYAEGILVRGAMDAGVMDGLLASPRASVVRDARARVHAFRTVSGIPGASFDVLTRPEGQAKLGKSERYALGLSLTPSRSLDVGRFLPGSRPVNVCPRASAGCVAACIDHSGRGAFDPVQFARQVRHASMLHDPYAFGVLAGAEISRALRKHGADGVTFRFNVFSDYRPEIVIPSALELMVAHGVRAYDYTAWTPDDRAPIAGYHLTYSAKESAHTSDAYIAGLLESGHNVAMVFATRKGEALPAWWTDGTPGGAHRSYRVIDGDLTDDRTTDPRPRHSGVVVGLRAKGADGIADTSGFVRAV